MPLSWRTRRLQTPGCQHFGVIRIVRRTKSNRCSAEGNRITPITPPWPASVRRPVCSRRRGRPPLGCGRTTGICRQQRPCVPTPNFPASPAWRERVAPVAEARLRPTMTLLGRGWDSRSAQASGPPGSGRARGAGLIRLWSRPLACQGLLTRHGSSIYYRAWAKQPTFYIAWRSTAGECSRCPTHGGKRSSAPPMPAGRRLPAGLERRSARHCRRKCARNSRRPTSRAGIQTTRTRTPPSTSSPALSPHGAYRPSIDLCRACRRFPRGRPGPPGSLCVRGARRGRLGVWPATWRCAR